MFKESEILELKSSLGEWKEGWGSGFQKIFDSCVRNGNGEPGFSERAGAFVVAFKVRKNGGTSGGTSGGISGGTSGGTNVLLEFIKKNEGLRANQIAELKGMSYDTIEKQLRALKKAGKIEFRGSKKTGGYYSVKGEGKH